MTSQISVLGRNYGFTPMVRSEPLLSCQSAASKRCKACNGSILFRSIHINGSFNHLSVAAVLVRDTDLLKSAFQIMPDYLRDVHRATAEIHFCDYGIQLTRSFRALKVWLSFQTFGLKAFRSAIDRGFELAELAEKELRSRAGWEILTPAQMATVCFRFGHDDALQTRLIEEMLRDGYAFLTSTKLRGEVALRLCTINPRTTEEEIRGDDRSARSLCPRRKLRPITPRHERVRIHALHDFSPLIRGHITQTNDAVLRFRLGNARLENFRNHAQGIAGPNCMWPA